NWRRYDEGPVDAFAGRRTARGYRNADQRKDRRHSDRGWSSRDPPHRDVRRRLALFLKPLAGGAIMNNGKEGLVREIMMGSPVTLKPDDTLDLANDIISLGRIRHIPVVELGRASCMDR